MNRLALPLHQRPLAHRGGTGGSGYRAAPFGFAALVLTTSGLLASGPSLQAVRLIVGDGATSVILTADGALPSPKVGLLTDPPRIYLDFPDVAAATEGTPVNGDLLVRGVRVAVNQSRPLVTRVVIDLARPAPYRIDAGLRGSGQITIVVGVPVVAQAGAPTPRALSQDVAEGAPAQPRPPPAEPPKAPVQAKAPPTVPAVPAAAPAAVRPPEAGEPATRAARSRELARGAGAAAVRAPAKDVSQYVERASSLLERLERLRPLLVSLDAVTSVPNDQLKAATEEFGSIRQALAAIAPPRALAATHELFRDVCVLGAASVTARLAPVAPDDSHTGLECRGGGGRRHHAPGPGAGRSGTGPRAPGTPVGRPSSALPLPQLPGPETSATGTEAPGRTRRSSRSWSGGPASASCGLVPSRMSRSVRRMSSTTFMLSSVEASVSAVACTASSVA